ncbi:hypothetical protein M514_00045 [Trichuris suis]|uniref:Uncharacterized protein n=1 Tax=Trichuris suis TaxID=68888 RepID=A0A085MNT6_9BILA|nr:hypothetical protein M513_00045 [Trichuris suis]KFD72905.1 hypothetical protein M514_00045 [Trichuris suis]
MESHALYFLEVIIIALLDNPSSPWCFLQGEVCSAKLANRMSQRKRGIAHATRVIDLRFAARSVLSFSRCALCVYDNGQEGTAADRLLPLLNPAQAEAHWFASTDGH